MIVQVVAPDDVQVWIARYAGAVPEPPETRKAPTAADATVPSAPALLTVISAPFAAGFAVSPVLATVGSTKSILMPAPGFPANRCVAPVEADW